VKSNRADTLVQLTRNGGLSHARGEHFPDALPQFRFGKMMRVGHVRSVSHGRRKKDVARSAVRKADTPRNMELFRLTFGLNLAEDVIRCLLRR
jgi:hypothetical protein